MSPSLPPAPAGNGPAADALAARHGGWAWLEGWGAFRCEGRDAVDLLGRLSSNDLAPLAGGRSLTTLFLTPTGRVLHRVLLLPGLGGRPVLALVEGGGAELPEWVERYTFAEDCRVVPEPTLVAAAVFGSEGLSRLPAEARDPGGVGAEGDVLCTRRDWPSLPAAIALAPPDALRSFMARIGPGLAALDADGLSQLRVEHGEPSSHAELGEERFPLEAGLAADISFTKGCYVGQEVVARQDTYGKVTRRLVGLAFDERPAPGEALTSEERDGCRVTSLAPEIVVIEDGRRVVPGLGYVLARHAAPGHVVTTASGVRGHVTALPLPRR